MLLAESFQLEHLLQATMEGHLKHMDKDEFASPLHLFGLLPDDPSSDPSRLFGRPSPLEGD